jgi:low molecular weight protein-tyrosine phosphatase
MKETRLMGKHGRPDRVAILFVCLGNICRSPLAEGVFRHLVKERGLTDRFEIDSAGTSSYHEGEPPDARSTAVAQTRGIRLSGSARQLVAADFDRFDYVITMDSEIQDSVERMHKKNHAIVKLLREYDPEARGNYDVPDPYYGGPRGFEQVQDMVERSCAQLLDKIVSERGW